MKKFLIKYAWSGWLGVSLAIAGIELLDWRYWLILLPMCLCIAIRDEFGGIKNHEL